MNGNEHQKEAKKESDMWRYTTPLLRSRLKTLAVAGI